jgi:hypothetical protein
MEPAVTIITNEIFTECLQREDLYEDCTKRIDLKALKKQIGAKTSIKRVMLYTRRHPDFKNIANNALTFKTFCCASATDDGARYETYGGNILLGLAHPLGDAFVVV